MAHETRSSQGGGTTAQANRPATPVSSYDRPVRTSGVNRKVALGGIAGLLALGGIITGLAVSNSSPPAPRLLGTFSGVGTRASATFTVPSGTVTARYSYACPAGSGSHAFAAALINSSRTEIDPIARTVGTGGTRTVTLHPSTPGGTYQIGATSACPYRVSVFAPGS
jgi:hypothetical protein